MNKVFVLFFSAVCFLQAQDVEIYFNQLAEDYFLLGMRQYTQKDFKTALQSFQLSIHSFPMNHRITAATIMEAKTYYALKNYTDAVSLCDSLLINFPQSEYKEDALFTKGMCYYNLGMYPTAIEAMLQVSSIAHQRKNQEHSLKMIEHIASEFLKEPEIDSVAMSVESSSTKRLLQVILAERLFSDGKFAEAKVVLDTVKTDTVNTVSIQQRVNGLYARIERGNLVRVCALLPLMKNSAGDTRDKRIAREVLEGVQLALEEYEEKITPQQVAVELRVHDSQRNRAAIDSIVTLLKGDSTIVAIIGPVFSDETIAAAVSAQREGIPLISPTATEDTIAAIGSFIFQTNSPTSMRGKILAQYAVNVLGAKKMAVIASDASTSKVQADSFSAEAKRLGGEIVADRRYKRGATDLREHFKAIRIAAAALSPEYRIIFKGKINTADIASKMLAFGLKPAKIDSLLSKGDTVNLTALIGDRAKDLADSLKLPTLKVFPYVDSLQYSVSSLDALFSPISTSQQIGVISSQLAYYNLKTTVVGTSDWYNISELDMNRRYADGVIFGGDHWIEQNDRTKRISARYSQQFGRQISDNVLFGYDVMSLVITLFNEGALTREQLVASLTSVVSFAGLRNSVTLTTGRVNGDLPILQYKNGVVSKLQTFTYHP